MKKKREEPRPFDYQLNIIAFWLEAREKPLFLNLRDPICFTMYGEFDINALGAAVEKEWPGRFTVRTAGGKAIHVWTRL